MKTIIALCVALCATTAQATYQTGNDLLKHLRDPDQGMQMYPTGYIIGIADAFNGGSHCIPEGVQVRQVRDVVKNFLEQTPEIRHRPGDVIVYVILKNTWPCPDKPKKKGSA